MTRRRAWLRVGDVRAALGAFLGQRGVDPRRIESLKWRGDGLFYTVFSFALSGAGPLDGGYVIRVLNPEIEDDEARDRLVRSARLLALLDRRDELAPRCLGHDETGGDLGFAFTVESFVPGLPVSEAPKDAQRWLPIAARELDRVHRIPLTEEIRALFPLRASFAEEELRRARAAVERLRERPDEVEEALAVAAAKLPEHSDPVLLHGDPLLQNLVVRLQPDGYTWIDWEFARVGDRAYDLSIFTRGQLGNLCGLDKGRTVYLDAYRKCAGAEVSERSVLFYEALLVMRQVSDVLRAREARYADEYLNRLRKLVGRLRSM